jgi:hypothetical protein
MTFLCIWYPSKGGATSIVSTLFKIVGAFKNTEAIPTSGQKRKMKCRMKGMKNQLEMEIG